MSAPVDWQALAERLGTLAFNDGVRSEQGGTKVAQLALTELLRTEAVLSAVDHYVDHLPGSELARSVLRELRPAAAMDRCMEVYRRSPDIDRVRTSIELLRWIGDSRILEWYPEIMQHNDAVVRCWGVGIIDQLWMDGEILEADAIARLDGARTDKAEGVRTNAEQVIEMIKETIALEASRSGHVG